MNALHDLNTTVRASDWFDGVNDFNGPALVSYPMDLPFFSKCFGHLYFHLPYGILLICYMLPFGPPCQSMIAIRVGLFGASTVQVLLAGHFQYRSDVMVWNAAFAVVNIIYVLVLFYQVTLKKFSPESEQLYAKLFYPLKVNREQFMETITCIKDIQSSERFEAFDDAQLTMFDILSLELRGKLLITTNSYIRHTQFPYRIFDCQACLDISLHELFQVSITVIEDSKVLLWDRHKLKSKIISNNFLHSVFDNALGQGIVKILIEERETMPNRQLPDHHRKREFKINFDMNDEKALQNTIQDVVAILTREFQDYIRKQRSDSISIHEDDN